MALHQKITTRRIAQTTSIGSLATLVFWCQKSWQNAGGVTSA